MGLNAAASCTDYARGKISLSLGPRVWKESESSIRICQFCFARAIFVVGRQSTSVITGRYAWFGQVISHGSIGLRVTFSPNATGTEFSPQRPSLSPEPNLR